MLPYRSNLPEISKFAFEIIDHTYYPRAMESVVKGGHAIVGGINYGQGSSREHAALAPRYLGLRVALVKDFARIHWQNLVNFGILPLTFKHQEDYEHLDQGDVLQLENVRTSIKQGNELTIRVKNKNLTIEVNHALSQRQVDVLLKGGMINWVKERQKRGSSKH